MRINKELRSLSKVYEITYVGVGTTNDDSYARDYCKLYYLVIGKRNHPITIIRQFILVTKLLRRHYDSIHIINEQLMIFFYPLLFRNHLVLDIFDSIFLTLNKGNNRLKWLKRIIYAPVDKILVTDQNRKTLMPEFTHPKIRILENYPNRYTEPIKKNPDPEKITILYNGWLGLNRGTEVIQKILALNRNVHVIMAGWFADKASKELAGHPQVDFRGTMSQQEALKVAAEEADYILCVYAPLNENNINASPNKIYDSIQTHTPVIINSEIRISSFVSENKIGVVINEYNFKNAGALVDELFRNKNTYTFSREITEKYVWENIEDILIEAHQV